MGNLVIHRLRQYLFRHAMTVYVVIGMLLAACVGAILWGIAGAIIFGLFSGVSFWFGKILLDKTGY
jgi:hypothetical protein